MATSTIKHENSVNITPSNYTASSSINVRRFFAHRSGNVVAVDLYFDVTTALANNQVLISFTDALPLPCGNYVFAIVRAINGNIGSVSIERADTKKITAWGAVPVGAYYYAQFVYMMPAS